MSTEPPELLDDFKADLDKLPALLKKAKAGDEGAVKELRSMVSRSSGDFAELACQPVSGMARKAMAQSIWKGHGNGDALITEGLLDRADTMERDLAGPNPSPIETLLASRIATCWLDCHLVDLMGTLAEQRQIGHRAAEHYDKLRSRSHDRLMSAFKALAYVRRVELHLLLQVSHAAIPRSAGSSADPPT